MRRRASNYMLVMTNTGMRTIEAYNLRWRDIDHRADRQGRSFVCLNVRGKNKFRELVAPNSVAEYLERIRATSKATKPDDFVFTSYDGTANASYYKEPIRSVLKEAELLVGAAGTVRSAYCFRHPVGETVVKAAVAEWKWQRREVFVPLTYRPGDLAEVDFFGVLVDVDGTRRKAWLFLMRLMYSGRDFAWIYERQDQVRF